MDAPTPRQVPGPQWLALLYSTGILARMKIRTQAAAIHIAYALPSGQGVLPVPRLRESSGMGRRAIQRSLQDFEAARVVWLRRVEGGASEVTLVQSVRTP